MRSTRVAALRKFLFPILLVQISCTVPIQLVSRPIQEPGSRGYPGGSSQQRSLEELWGIPFETPQVPPASPWEQKRFPVDCATPTRATTGGTWNLSEFLPVPLLRGVTKDPRWEVPVLRRVTEDPRWDKAELLGRQGLLDAAHASLLALLCEWPDALSKPQILSALVANRAAAGDLEAAAWFGEKYLAAEKYKTAWLEKLGARPQIDSEERKRWEFAEAFTTIHVLLAAGEAYARLEDGRKAKEKISEIESVLNRLQRDGMDPYVFGADVPIGLPEIYLDLARLYVLAGDIGASQQALRRWEAEAAKSPGPQRRGLTSIFLAILSDTYVQAEEYVEAKRWAEAALRIADKASPVYEGSLLSARLTLGMVAVAEGNGAAALQYLDEEAIARLRQEAIARLRQEERAKATESGIRGRLPFAEHDRARAEAVDYRQRAKFAWSLGQAYALAGQLKKATPKLLEAVEVIENLRGFVGANDRLAFFGKHTGPYHSLIENLLRLEEAGEKPSWKELERRGRSIADLAFYYAESARARLLSEQMARSQLGGAEGKVPLEITQRERELRSKADLELRSGIPYDVSHAYREFQAFTESLRNAYPDYATLKYPIPVTASQVPLREKEALLAYFVLDRSLVVWLLQAGQETRVFQVRVARGRVLDAIRALRASLEPGSSGSLPVFNGQASGDLYQWLLAEPVKRIPPRTRIIVIPDSELGTIPFEVLGIGNVDFAGRRYTFSYAPSATVLAHQRRPQSGGTPPHPQGRLLAVGDPVYHEADARTRKAAGPADTSWIAARGIALRDFSEKRGLGIFSRLRWTSREVGDVASALGVPAELPDVRLGVDASEHDIKALELTGYRYLHFATHGVLADDLPYLKQPALVLAQVGDLKGEDGFLTMEEVMALRLGADLTVLSACQTGLGQKISGEGIVGLMRAFLYAGSRSVLVSLWRVEDEATAVLMGKFYQYIAQGLPSAEALSRSKQHLREERAGRFAHPFYWAPFILFASD